MPGLGMMVNGTSKVNGTSNDTLVTETPVLIIGASMIGMTISALLAKQHLTGCITVEKHASTAIHPRAALFHPRTMQIYNELGLYHHMRNHSLQHYDEHAGIYNVESLAGKHLSTYMHDLNQGLDKISPFPRLFLTQQMFEPLLKDCATSYGADLRFSTEMIEFEQDEDGVTALIRDTNTGQVEKIRAKYMVAADGSRSKVREKLGIQVKGHGTLSDSITIYFKANLGPFIEGKYNGVIYVNNDRVRGFFRLNKSGDEGFLVVSTYGDKHNDESRFPSVGITEAKAAEILRAAIGADVPFEITHLSPWTARCDVAKSLNVGRVLLAGDAAHVNTPHGGFGGNTGIQDAHNLAWKLAKVLQGKGGRQLVEKTYNAERQPVGEKTVNQVFTKYLARTDPELPFSARWQGEVDMKRLGLEDEAPETWLELGYRYPSHNVPNISFDKVLEDPATAKAVPGSLARHVDITTHDRSGTGFALAELLGQDFVLIIGEKGEPWASVLNSGPLVEFRNIVKSYILEPNQNWPFYNKYAILSTGCVLIRPDAVVVWSTSELPAEEGFTGFGLPSGSQVLRSVLRQALCYDSKAV